MKYVRIALAWIFILSIMWLFLDATGLAAQWVGWMAKIQFLPAVLSLNILAILAVVGITILFGRIYCSIVCPLGVMQDGFNWLRSITASSFRQQNRFRYTQPRQRLRLIILVAFVALFLIGGIWSMVAALIAPYSSFGRIMSTFAAILRPEGSTAWNIVVGAVAITTFVILGVWSFFRGRDYCNTVCPVGTVLGFLSRWSVFGIVIDADKCISCGKCGKRCKASCIDVKNHFVDNTRCVDCMDCIDNCSTGAISFTRRQRSAKKVAAENSLRVAPTIDESRRTFLLSSAVIAGATVVAKAQKTPLADKTDPSRPVRLTPPGSKSLENLADHCTRCQLCINKCPNHVLTPSTQLDTLLMPSMSYLDGYCRVDCNVCSTVCPTGSIVKILPDDRRHISVGVASVTYDLCLAASEGKKCGRCARACPAFAIVMMPVDPKRPDGYRMPVVDESACLGCGGCEYVCPVSPVSAITVNGRNPHKEL